MTTISVIITTYNQEKYIAEAIESVLSQKDCPKFEIIIGNDCSTDSTPKIVEEYKQKYPEIIKVLPRPYNLGLKKNLKNCFENCSGDYIAICEGDDYWVDCHKLKKQYELLKNSSEALFCFNDIYIQNEIIGKTKYKRHFKSLKKRMSPIFTFKDLVEKQNPIANFSCVMYKREVLKYIPDEYWDAKSADFLLHMYLLDKATGIFLKDICSVYRMNNNSIYAGVDNEEKVLYQISNIIDYNKIFNYKYKKSFYILLQKFIRDLLKEKVLFSFKIPFISKKINITKSSL